MYKCLCMKPRTVKRSSSSSLMSSSSCSRFRRESISPGFRNGSGVGCGLGTSGINKGNKGLRGTKVGVIGDIFELS